MQTLRRSKPLWVLFLFVGALALIASSAGSSSAVWADPGKKKKKLSQRQMKKKMKGWARALGKKCIFCHIKDDEEYDYEAETPKKKIAAYCEEQFIDKLFAAKGKKITCATCHPQKPVFLPREEKKDQGG